MLSLEFAPRALPFALLCACYIPVQQGDPSAGYGPAPATAPEPGAGSEAAPPAAPAQPQTYSLTLHNSCRETVNLFVGEQPPFSSGTYGSLGSNTTQSYSGFAPQTIWIVDASRNPVSSYSIGPGSQRVEILESCAGFGPY